jgi:hypothetical protein
MAITGPDHLGDFSVIMPNGSVRKVQYEDQLDAIEVECGELVTTGDGLLKIRPRPQGSRPTRAPRTSTFLSAPPRRVNPSR